MTSLCLQTFPHSPSNSTGHPVPMALPPTRSTESSRRSECKRKALSSSQTTQLRHRDSVVAVVSGQHLTAIKTWISVLPGKLVCPSTNTTHSRHYVPPPDSSSPGLFPLVLRSRTWEQCGMGPRTGECGWQESEAQLSELKTVPMSLVPL